MGYNLIYIFKGISWLISGGGEVESKVMSCLWTPFELTEFDNWAWSMRSKKEVKDKFWVFGQSNR